MGVLDLFARTDARRGASQPGDRRVLSVGVYEFGRVDEFGQPATLAACAEFRCVGIPFAATDGSPIVDARSGEPATLAVITESWLLDDAEAELATMRAESVA